MNENKKINLTYKAATLEILVQDAVKRGIKHITLEAIEMGRPLYEKYGLL